MTRLLVTTALLGILLAAPAWAQTMTPKMHHHARHHHAAVTNGSGSSESMRHHRYITSDHSADMLNRKVLRDLQNGS
jgi:hypothetical protein